MASILYSCFGTTDPVRGMRDGSLMQILRFYRPDVVYLFLSKEIMEQDQKDQRIGKTFQYIRENWGGYSPCVIRYETEIEDPSDMDILINPMKRLFQRMVDENPGAEVLVNLSSGTPQMQVILSQMALDSRYLSKGIQVKSPERSSSSAARTNANGYLVDEELRGNKDEKPNVPNRCVEPKMLAIHREAVRNQLGGLLSQRNYAAIAQMGDDLPAPIPQLARHLDYRSQFLLDRAEQEASSLPELRLEANQGVYPGDVYEMIEYFAILKSLVYLKRYTDFVLRLNPFLIRLQLMLLEEQLQLRGLCVQDLIWEVDGCRKIGPAQIKKYMPELLAFLETKLGRKLQEKEISIGMMNIMLRYFRKVEKTVLRLLRDCERVNRKLRNSAAHNLFTVTNAHIRDTCGSDAEKLIQELEQVLQRSLERYGDKNLNRRINIYEDCDRMIRACL